MTTDDDRPDYRRGPAPKPRTETDTQKTASPPEPPPPHLTRQAINDCQLCDTDGYTPTGRICDHQDHTTPAKRGIAAIRAQMGWTK
jgi:hypothetical protein